MTNLYTIRVNVLNDRILFKTTEICLKLSVIKGLRSMNTFSSHCLSLSFFYSRCTLTSDVTPPEINEHFTVLFEDAQLEDNVHDVEIKVN